MKRTIKEATVERCHHDNHQQLEKHLADVSDAIAPWVDRVLDRE